MRAGRCAHSSASGLARRLVAVRRALYRSRCRRSPTSTVPRGPIGIRKKRPVLLGCTENGGHTKCKKTYRKDRDTEIAPEPAGHGLPLSKCEAYNRVYEQP